MSAPIDQTLGYRRLGVPFSFSMLAETVQISAGEAAVIIAILVTIAVVAVATVVFGFILAPRAGRGSRQAMGWWIIILAVEGMASLGSVAEILTLDFTVWAFIPLAVVGGQVALYMRARKKAGR